MESQEAKTFIQVILIRLMFAFGCAAIWLCSAAIFYYLQSEETAPSSRVAWAATAATMIVAAFVGAAKLYRARHGRRLELLG